jgi:flagellar hook-length control protein FliK
MNLNVISALLATGDGKVADEAMLSLDDTELSSSFAQLLGERFIPDGHVKGKLAATPLPNSEPQAPALSRQQLNQLLASFSERGQLLTKPHDVDEVTDSAPLHAASDDEKPLQPLTDVDPATLQALFAMLPGTSTQPLPEDNRVVAGEQPGDETALVPTSSLLATLSENADQPTPHLTGQQHQPKAEDKPTLAAKTDTSAVLPASAETHRDNGTASLKLAGEPVQASSAIHHAAPVPVSSPATTPPVSATVNAPATPQLNAQLGSQEWQQALSQQVLMFHRNGQQSAELRLHPQELGALQITLKLDDNQAQLHIASAHGLVRSAVEAAIPHLRHALAESGINLGQSSVGSESLPQPQQQQTSHSGGQPSYREQHGNAQADVDIVSAPAALQSMARAVDGVDIFA